MKVSSKNTFEFVSFSATDLLQLTSWRKGETKLGESIVDSENTAKKFVILGVCEDLGPQANGGNAGAKSAFSSFLAKFLSMQSNAFLDGKDILIPGYINQKVTEIPNFDSSPNCINELDDFVVEILTPFIEQGYTQIVIGGGHNNAFPILKSFSTVLKKAISVVNCDAHADFRKRDFRHSGNPFSFAFYENYISKYAVLGLHQSYNNQFILDELKTNEFFVSYYDDYILGQENFSSDFEGVINYFIDSPFGVELDMDSIEYMPSSASSPSGISMNEARMYVSFFARKQEVLYLHLPEAAPKSMEDELYVGKSLAYLVTDFIKNYKRD
ncbi:MAG: arginase family protein [Flavobacteriia bacterium]|jgi:formiminoglutamase